MPVSRTSDGPTWRRRTRQADWLRYAAWVALAILFAFCWEVMNRGTLWVFVEDAPQQAADLAARSWPPRWDYLPRLWEPLWTRSTWQRLAR